MDSNYIGGMSRRKTTKRATKKKGTKRGKGVEDHVIAGNLLTDLLGLGKVRKLTKKRTTKKKSTKKGRGSSAHKIAGSRKKRSTKKKSTKKGRGSSAHKIGGAKRKKTTKKASKKTSKKGGNIVTDVLGLGLGKKGSKKPTTRKRKTRRGGDFMSDISSFASSVANNPIVKGISTVAPIIGNLAPLLMAAGKKDPNAAEKPKTALQKYTTEIKQVERKLANTEKDFIRETRVSPQYENYSQKQWAEFVGPTKKRWAEERKTVLALAHLKAIEELYQLRHSQYLRDYRRPV